MTKDAFIHRIQELTLLPDAQSAEDLVYIVFNILRHRLTQDEADDVAAQLPNELGKLWNDDSSLQTVVHKVMQGPNLQYKTRNEMYDLVGIDLRKKNIQIAPAEAVNVVFHLLKELLSKGEVDDILAQLPSDLTELLKQA